VSGLAWWRDGFATTPFLAFLVAANDQTAGGVVDLGPDETLDAIGCEICDVISAMVDWESVSASPGMVILLRGLAASACPPLARAIR
jgi:hypothetical protein